MALKHTPDSLRPFVTTVDELRHLLHIPRVNGNADIRTDERFDLTKNISEKPNSIGFQSITPLGDLNHFDAGIQWFTEFSCEKSLQFQRRIKTTQFNVYVRCKRVQKLQNAEMVGKALTQMHRKGIDKHMLP